MSDTTYPTNLAAALVAALAQMTGVTKGRKADAGKYSYAYANLEDVVALSRPILAEHGLTAIQSLGHDEGKVTISTTIIHTSGESITLGPVAFHAGNNAQDAGSSITYYRRYALLAALGLAAEDDDGAAASRPPANVAPKSRPEPAPTVSAKVAKNQLVERITQLGFDDPVTRAQSIWADAGDPKGPFDEDALHELFARTEGMTKA